MQTKVFLANLGAVYAIADGMPSTSDKISYVN